MSKRAEERARAFYSSENFDTLTLLELGRKCFSEGYEQAEKDYIELAQLWVCSGDANIMSFKQFLKMKLEEK